MLVQKNYKNINQDISNFEIYKIIKQNKVDIVIIGQRTAGKWHNRFLRKISKVLGQTNLQLN